VVKLSTMLIDDEPLALKLLNSMLAEYPDIEVVAQCRSPKEAVKKIQFRPPDLLFLDIHMPVLSGFDVVKKLQADVLPMIVFVTAYDKYALQAFDLHAVDYILKPIDPDRLSLAVERARQRYQVKDVASGKSILLNALATINDGAQQQTYNFEFDGISGNPNKLVIRDGAHTDLVQFDDIDWIDAAGDYMCIHVGPKTHVMRSTMKELAGKLPANKFSRIHRSTIVNVTKVQGFESLARGESLLLLPNNVSLKVSRNFREVTKKITA